eukprot:781471_1
MSSVSLDWNNTILQDGHPLYETLKLKDIKQLLINRGANKRHTKGTKAHLIQALKQNHTPSTTRIQQLTVKQLIIELKLLDISHRRATRKDELSRALTDGIKDMLSHQYYQKIEEPHCIPNCVVQISKKEFIFGTRRNMLYRYNIRRDEWNPSIVYPPELMTYNPCVGPGIPSVAFNKKDKRVYIFDEYCGFAPPVLQLFIFDWETQEKIKSIATPLTLPVIDCICLDHESQLHIICEYVGHPLHFIFDTATETFDKGHELHGYPESGELFYIATKRQLLLIEEYNVCYYGLVSKIWRKMSVIPEYIRCWNAVSLTVDERYAIFVKYTGSQTQWDSIMDEYTDSDAFTKIAVMDLHTSKSNLCNIHGPVALTSEPTLFIVGDEMREGLIVFGYMRRCWNEYDIGLDIFPPQYIVNLIKVWFVQDYVHFLHEKDHWRIPVDDILNNLCLVCLKDDLPRSQ